jgi:hypothetical protein
MLVLLPAAGAAGRRMTSYELFALMSPGLAGEVIEFNHESDRNLYRATLEAVAQARKMRTKFLERLPRPERQATLVGSLSCPGLAMAADTLLRNWLLKSTRPCRGLPQRPANQTRGAVVEDLPKTVTTCF